MLSIRLRSVGKELRVAMPWRKETVQISLRTDHSVN